MLEVHPDMYGMVPDLEARARERLSALGVWEKVDSQCLRQALGEARGIPVSVGATK